MKELSSELPWVIFHLLDEQYAVSANYVREMVAMPKVIHVPQTPDHIRGVINLRGRVLPVMDLRLKLGMSSMLKDTDELVELLEQREQDHLNWIAELESSVQERREFKLATDHRKCAFGKWFDNFETDDRILSTCLKKFDAPHQKIHSIAVEVKELEGQEDFDGAYAIINQTKENELAEMIRLFAESRDLLRHSKREIALVLDWQDKGMVISVDSVETVEKISESTVDALPETFSTKDNECITGIGRRSKNNELVQLLEVGNLIGNEKDLVPDDATEN